MKKHIINIDKINLLIANNDIKLIEKSNFTIEYLLPAEKKLYNNDYHSTIRISHNETPFLILFHKMKSNNDFSLIYILNDRLYTNDWNIILQDFIITYKIKDYSISKLEIAINTNKIITSKYLKLFKKGLIDFKDNYSNQDCYDYGKTEDHLTKDFSKRTYYIYNKNKKSIRIKELRIEDKTNEIRDNNNTKEYILDFYKNNGLNTTKSVYRLELTLNFTELKKIISDVRHREINNPTNIITNYKYKKLTSTEKHNYSTIKYVRDYNRSIDLLSLTNEIYLTKIFNSFVMINYDILVKPLTNEAIDFQYKIKSDIIPDRQIFYDNDHSKRISLEVDNLFHSDSKIVKAI